MEASNPFIAVMSEKESNELVAIVTVKRKDYQPLAVETAEKELEKRNLPPETYAHLEKEAQFQEQYKKEQVIQKNMAPLPLWAKFLIFLIPAAFFVGIVFIFLGYKKYGVGICKWSALGLLFYYVLFGFLLR